MCSHTVYEELILYDITRREWSKKKKKNRNGGMKLFFSLIYLFLFHFIYIYIYGEKVELQSAAFVCFLILSTLERIL